MRVLAASIRINALRFQHLGFNLIALLQETRVSVFALAQLLLQLSTPGILNLNIVQYHRGVADSRLQPVHLRYALLENSPFLLQIHYEHLFKALPLRLRGAVHPAIASHHLIQHAVALLEGIQQRSLGRAGVDEFLHFHPLLLPEFVHPRTTILLNFGALLVVALKTHGLLEGVGQVLVAGVVDLHGLVEEGFQAALFVAALGDDFELLDYQVLKI